MIQQSFNSIVASLLGSGILKNVKRGADIAEESLTETRYTEEGEEVQVPKGRTSIGGTSESDPVRPVYTGAEYARLQEQIAEGRGYEEGRRRTTEEATQALGRGFRGGESAFGDRDYNLLEQELRSSTDPNIRGAIRAAERRAMSIRAQETERANREARNQRAEDHKKKKKGGSNQ